MRVFDKSCETLESAGSRRGAQMGMIRCDHPDIEDFVNAKRDGSLANFNMSVAVTDTFMDAVESDGEVELWHAAEPYDKEGASRRADGTWAYRRVRARDLFDQMMHSTYDHAEPGVVFIDRVNRDDNLSYCESIAATNPCGEEPLPSYGCCCLGSINLTPCAIRLRTARVSISMGSVKWSVWRSARWTTCWMRRCGRWRSRKRKPGTSGAWAWGSPAWATR